MPGPEHFREPFVPPEEKTHTYTCEGCGIAVNMTEEDAFQAGWDTPERFMSHCTCPNCGINTTVWWKLMTDHGYEVTEEDIKLLMAYKEIWDTRAHPEYKAIMEGQGDASESSQPD